MKNIPVTLFDPIYQEKIATFIDKLLLKKQQEFITVNMWGTDITEKLLSFVSSGKMLRGCLTIFIYEAYTEKITEEVISIASVMELFHSSLLVHDDIMDKDAIRRGRRTIFAQYQALGEQKGFIASHHFGESMGICVGDIGFFLGFQLLSSLKESNAKQTIMDICMKEMISVGLAQMQDVYAGYSQDTITKEDIEKVYIYKTGRYTFSLPMMMGAVLANQDKKTMQQLEKLGEVLGLLFQLKDDALSLFGSEKNTGKPEGSDIRENKKTLYRFYLFEKASPMQSEKLAAIFGKEAMTNAELLYVRELVNTLQIQQIIDKKIADLRNIAKQHIIALALPAQRELQMIQLLEYIVERKK